MKIDAFPAVFAAGVDPATAAVPAHSQRPLSAIAFGENASAAPWKTKPGWGIVSSADHTINPDVERFGYQRARLRSVVAVDAPHLVMHADPAAVVDVSATAIKELA